MLFLENMILNIVIMMFPILIYFFVEMYNDNFDQERQYLIFDLALLSSLYLTIRYNMNVHMNYSILLDVILLLAFKKKRIFTIILLSFILIWYYSLTIPLWLLLTQYSFYGILYGMFQKKNFIPIFLCNKFAFHLLHFFLYSYNIESFLFLLTDFLLFIVVTYAVLYIFARCEEVVKLHTNIQELEQEKQIRTSLFKITHEIKNPIAVCKSYLDMFDFHNSEHEKYIPIMKEEIQKILLLLQDFLSMNKIQVKKEIMDINYLLEDVIHQFEPALKSNNIKFIQELEEDEIFIEGDYNRLSQVMINMFKNAMEAMKEENRYLAIRSKIEQDSIIITLEDNGYGITKEDMKRIKEPFYTTKKNGTGLGVSLSCEIISAHKGTIRYFSKENVGTKVMITLPLDTTMNSLL